MDMWVMLQLLVPGMQHAEEADLGAEVLRIGGDLQEGLRAAAEQDAVHELLVLQGEGRQLVRKCEHHMSIGNREQFRASRRQPAVARLALALRAVPVPARVIRDGLMAAGRALVEMTAHRDGTASLDGDEHFEVQPGKPSRRMIDQSVTRCGYDVGQLQERPLHSILCESDESGLAASKVAPA